MRMEIGLEHTRRAELSPNEWTEEELLRRMLTRDEPAWREFVRRFERLMRSAIDTVLKRFYAVLGSADRDDIYACLLLGLQSHDMHRLRAFDAERGVRLSGWLSLLARNTAWDFLRGKSRRFQQTSWATGIDDVPSNEADVLQTLQAREALAHVELVLPQLSERDRTFVRLYYLEGLDPLQVSRAMQISVKTVYSKNHKLRARLSASLECDGSAQT